MGILGNKYFKGYFILIAIAFAIAYLLSMGVVAWLPYPAILVKALVYAVLVLGGILLVFFLVIIGVAVHNLAGWLGSYLDAK
ncbi:MAG: hypothetical protein A2748_00165 [Candidatus Wildermuthbacteria bacterium RIFCSPHIGHO2_01_FULL_45_20]|uniref:Uncharacterized protein n=1 Tax=Candidatus Wildermuthbacteria bacterium RIFCSPHIGHO2_02_FULL_45_25 TaxID=1802450 RepID=A0A1G2R3M2_9BACT|nr:MAG: hypothetical protein A2748_00165 [Candidatus Wildermuthbacteria bacterium RIFCSPHIGHO2_01_FULL_45_20]OHA67317.1 MAG: hypothetical protein A3C04_01190 [Candidatus Wildermuthbacteria bacterium RIFCSPHIGHO2_02_FULL_45_25]